LCHKLNEFIEIAEKDSSKLQTQLNEVLMAQGFQDLTGQILRRVIELVREVEDSLIHLLTMFGTQENNNEVDESELLADASKPEGPIINADERDDVVSGQDDVDDLLSSLGF
jgi:chemotaxis protein CheZ